MKPEVISETPITISELKEELKKIKERDGELNFRANKTNEYIENFGTPKLKDVQELKSKIEALEIPRLNNEHIAKIIDISPESLEDIKTLMQSYTVSVTQDNLKKVLDVIKENKK